MINNKKGTTIEERFIDVISDPCNLMIKRVKTAGTVENNHIILHNGLKVNIDCWKDMKQIFLLNGGVHEPAEEFLFSIILKYIPENGTMIELGSNWAFYTMWFNKEIKNAKNYCIEPDSELLQCGIENSKYNNITANFTQGFVGINDNDNNGCKNEIHLYNYIKSKNIDYIDMLHSDIQGSEYNMLLQISELLDQNKIRYLFISTHSDEIHYKCIDFLELHNYRIIASSDVDTETFCYDGIIVACHKDNTLINNIPLPVRKTTPLRNAPYEFNYY
jgi:hypothetical protein